MKSFLSRHALAALVVACALLYLPRAGSYGLWDPWETHYGEIARQMVMRGDAITPWWPGSPVDRPEVFHKPVLHFWLMALSMKLAGLERPGALPSEMVDSWRPEWAARVPNILLSIAALAVLWWAIAKLRSRRAAWASVIVLATSAQWLLITRQAMTDLPFVAPMTIALACVAVALHAYDAASPPTARMRALALAGLVAIVLPQLVLFSLQLSGVVRIGARAWSVPGVVPMLPYIALLPIAIFTCARTKTRRQLLLHVAWVMCALASLAKGPAGLALPALTIALYLVLVGRAREILRLELVRGALLFVVVAFPWYHAMHIRHGLAFWRELIGDNYLNRATGRSGDRGTFEYYVPWIGYGLFPWCGVAVVGVLRALSDPRRALAAFALVWAAVDLATVTLVTTKFHHYVLPAMPALAILAGLAIEDFWLQRLRPVEIGLVALPLVALCGRDLATLPARLEWLFCYDYVLVPGAGRPWPPGPRYDFCSTLAAFTVAAALVTLLAMLACRRWQRLRAIVMAAMTLVALAWSIFLVDDYLVTLSPHWSQKQVIAAYYRQRHDPTEPLIAWNLYWRGENFYSRNQISSSPDPKERTEWAYIDVPKAMREYLPRHHQRLFFLVDRARYNELRANLGALAGKMQIVDESNNKLYLVLVDARQSDEQAP